jgi:uncharacterized membrane protein/sporulation protein YlmC with PRC-barrel domain
VGDSVYKNHSKFGVAMDFPIDVDVFCSDGQYGKSTTVIIDPVTEKVTFVAVSDPNRLYTEYLVPVSEVINVDSSKIELKCTKTELEQMEKFAEAEYLDVPYYGYDSLNGMSDPLANIYRKENIPEGTVTVSRGMAVEATDGFVGTVDELVINPNTGQITHMVLRTGHIWGSAEITIPVSQIKSIDALAVHLDGDKNSIETLPIVQIRRHYSKEEINKLNIEILIWAFDTADQAQAALQHLKSYTKENSIEIRNAAILMKDTDGKTKAREIADLGPRRGGITGLIAGGLIGLFAGPGGAIVGAAAGAATGGIAAQKIDRGFSNDYLSMLESKMKPGSSGLLTLVESSLVPNLIEELKTFGGQIYQQKVTDGVISDLAT